MGCIQRSGRVKLEFLRTCHAITKLFQIGLHLSLLLYVCFSDDYDRVFHGYGSLNFVTSFYLILMNLSVIIIGLGFLYPGNFLLYYELFIFFSSLSIYGFFYAIMPKAGSTVLDPESVDSLTSHPVIAREIVTSDEVRVIPAIIILIQFMFVIALYRVGRSRRREEEGIQNTGGNIEVIRMEHLVRTSDVRPSTTIPDTVERISEVQSTFARRPGPSGIIPADDAVAGTSGEVPKYHERETSTQRRFKSGEYQQVYEETSFTQRKASLSSDSQTTTVSSTGQSLLVSTNEEELSERKSRPKIK